MSNNHESKEKIKHKKITNTKNIVLKEKNNLNSNSKKTNKNIDSNKSYINIIYENKNIIINDITNNYNSNTNFHKAFNNKIKKMKINKLKPDDISVINLIK